MGSVKISVNGMDNRARPEALPEGKLRNAVNVIFTDTGDVQFPRPGKTVRYAGNCHSVYENKFNTLFVEDGALKRLNDDNTATSLLATWGNSRTFYAVVGDTIYCSNDNGSSGKVRNGIASEWGTARPPRQPDCFPIATGDLYAGDYRVSITWIADEESGTGMGKRVTVQDGGGIRVTNLPTPPAYVKSYALYVSSVNGKDMYLYGEYGIDITEVHIGRLTDESVLPTVPLTTQFCFVPVPVGVIASHYGRIYYPRGNKVYFTKPHSYGLQKSNSYLPFDTEVQTINSCPNVLYVGTKNKFGKIINIDADDGSPPIIVPLLDCGTTKGSETRDPDEISSYVMSDIGFLKLTSEGVQELTSKDVAMPAFETGAMTVVEYDGTKYLIGAFQDGVQNPLANKQYNIDELARGSL